MVEVGLGTGRRMGGGKVGMAAVTVMMIDYSDGDSDGASDGASDGDGDDSAGGDWSVPDIQTMICSFLGGLGLMRWGPVLSGSCLMNFLRQVNLMRQTHNTGNPTPIVVPMNSASDWVNRTSVDAS